ncbi:MAG: transglutaminase domain-containing protein [bacterium]
MRAAIEAAKAAGPESALYHELAATLARFEDRERDELDHLARALLDPAGDAPIYLLNRLVALHWTYAERARLVALFEALRRDHPRADVRAMAAWMSSHSLHIQDRAAEQQAAVDAVTGRLKLTVIGTWDNDQGKGFDAEYPPERELDLGKRYLGSRLEVGWRDDLPEDPRGKLHLHAMMEPVRWQVAYGAAAVKVQAAGDYELRLSTTDPVKVWVNDILVFTGQRLSSWTFDGVVLPVKLRAGTNRVLIKTAHGEAGAWMLVARITGPGGAPIGAEGLAQVKADSPVADGARPVERPYTEESLIPQAVEGVPDGPRKGLLAAAFTEDVGLAVPRVKIAEALFQAYPDALLVRWLKAAALWDNQERGSTSDLLNELSEKFGAELPLLALKQARFWDQQNLREKARQQLTALWTAHPDRDGAAFALADILEREKWNEERCQILEKVDARQPGLEHAREALAECYEALRFYPRAEAIYTDLLKNLPNSYTALKRMHWLHQGNDNYPSARAYAERWARAWPHDREAWEALGETLRRARDPAGARAAWMKLVQMAPMAAEAYDRLARLAMQGGDRAQAISLWKEALARDPENESLANRLQYLAPEKSGPWLADVPGEDALEAAIRQRDAVKPADGTDLIYLMDDEVTSLAPDGSTINVVTLVAHAVNQAGRDNLTQMSLRSSRARVMHAFAVDALGKRIEASSIRGGVVRFRQLGEGSTVVLQYRVDQRPDGYLARFLARQWWFQAPGVQTVISRWVLWAPKGTTFLEEGRGGYEHTQVEKDDQIRVVWQARDTPPVLIEPSMPTLSEVAWHVAVSSVPDWDTFWRWEKALLQDAFRTSPELETLAATLAQGATTPAQKVQRIHAYLMTNIRYQQDYEGAIAGVKPHAAPVVMARQYGDCKDKAVLFIALARLMGIEVHFALVRTRDGGPVRLKVPMQQFNHAIVYVPAQEGIPEGRFYDPTVDALDVDVLRHDDQGTLSLVFNPMNDQHSWRPIPYQDASVDTTLVDTALTLAPDGRAQGEMELSAHGRMGSLIRRAARNPSQFGQLMQQQVVRTFAGARLEGHQAMQIDSVLEPARVQLQLTVPSLARREGSELRLKPPIEWSPQDWFGLADRQHPVLLGSPRTLRWKVTARPAPAPASSASPRPSTPAPTASASSAPSPPRAAPSWPSKRSRCAASAST